MHGELRRQTQKTVTIDIFHPVAGLPLDLRIILFLPIICCRLLLLSESLVVMVAADVSLCLEGSGVWLRFLFIPFLVFAISCSLLSVFVEVGIEISPFSRESDTTFDLSLALASLSCRLSTT